MEVEFSNKTWVLFLRHYIVLFASWCVFIPDNKLGPPSVLYHVQIVSNFFFHKLENKQKRYQTHCWSKLMLESLNK